MATEFHALLSASRKRSRRAELIRNKAKDPAVAAPLKVTNIFNVAGAASPIPRG